MGHDDFVRHILDRYTRPSLVTRWFVIACPRMCARSVCADRRERSGGVRQAWLHCRPGLLFDAWSDTVLSAVEVYRVAVGDWCSGTVSAQLRPEHMAWFLHEWITVPSSFQNARLQSSRTMADFAVSDLGQHGCQVIV